MRKGKIVKNLIVAAAAVIFAFGAMIAPVSSKPCIAATAPHLKCGPPPPLCIVFHIKCPAEP